jgi:hypothetical protein
MEEMGRHWLALASIFLSPFLHFPFIKTALLQFKGPDFPYFFLTRENSSYIIAFCFSAIRFVPLHLNDNIFEHFPNAYLIRICKFVNCARAAFLCPSLKLCIPLNKF